jgi:NAD dependent epimerase/dehydratase family enzyme
VALLKFRSVKVIGIPPWALHMALGERKALMLDSCRMSNAKLCEAGFQFEHNQLREALRHLRSNAI